MDSNHPNTQSRAAGGVRPNKAHRTIVLVAFESQFAKSGGLGAVMTILPKELHRSGERCILIAPHFPRITDLEALKRNAQVKEVAELTDPDTPFEVTDDKCSPPLHCPLRLTRITDENDFQTYLVGAETFFTAPSDPYVNPRDPENPLDPRVNPDAPELLLRDSLLFCAAIPRVLAFLGFTSNVVLHLQDWETACAALATSRSGAIHGSAAILTLHNPYDRAVALSSSTPLLASLVQHLGLRYTQDSEEGIIQQALPFIDTPLTTVSQNFADELTTSRLQHDIFAPQLQRLFETHGVVGVNNGVFGKVVFPFSTEAEADAKRGVFSTLSAEKRQRAQKLRDAFSQYRDTLSKRRQDLGLLPWPEVRLDLADPEKPVFLFFGRDDPRQKGFDVAAAAIARVPIGRARYVFTPIPGNEGLEGLRFLLDLEIARPEEVLILPFRLDPHSFPGVFPSLQNGVSYHVMCSLYEPFGAATEAYLAGAPVVARATGGLVQQVVPHTSASLSRHGRILASLYHQPSDLPTGFLYREPAVVNEQERLSESGTQHAVDHWRALIACDYRIGDRVNGRVGNSLFAAMVQRAAWTIQDAIDLYTECSDTYAKTVYAGYCMLERFNWKHTVAGYKRVYDRICA